MEKNHQRNIGGTILIFFQSIIISGLWLHYKIERWNIWEELTVFIAPFYIMFISGLLIISFLISLIYFAIELVKTQKGYTAIPVLINLLVLLIGFTFFNEIKLREYNFNKYADVRNEIIEMIVEGELSIDEKGRIEIPKYYEK